MAASLARGQGAIALCPRCRREILPKPPGPQLRGVHRGKRDDTPDPRAERKRASKARKQAKRAGITRADVRQQGFLGVAKLYLEAKAEPAVVDEECPDCLKRQRGAA